MDEESDLIEVVDIEGDLTAPPAEEAAPEVEEFEVDIRFWRGCDLEDQPQATEPKIPNRQACRGQRSWKLEEVP